MKVAAVSGADGFSYLLGKLVSAFATDQGRPEAASASLKEALELVLKHCLTTPSLKLAVTEGLCQASTQDLSLQHIASDLTPEQQVSLAVSTCSSASASWKQQGVLVLLGNANACQPLCAAQKPLSPSRQSRCIMCRSGASIVFIYIHLQRTGVCFPCCSTRGVRVRSCRKHQSPGLCSTATCSSIERTGSGDLIRERSGSILGRYKQPISPCCCTAVDLCAHRP